MKAEQNNRQPKTTTMPLLSNEESKVSDHKSTQLFVQIFQTGAKCVAQHIYLLKNAVSVSNWFQLRSSNQ